MKPSKSNRPFLISITGDIASGKSFAKKYFQDKDYQVYSADEINAQILKDKVVIKQLSLIFGKSILNKKPENGDYEIDKAKFRKKIFSKEKNVIILSNYLHPMILTKMLDYVTNSQEKILIFEVPLLFECDLIDCFDLNVLITADYQTKIDRVMIRDNCTESTAKNILKNQISQEVKQILADVVIDNSSDFESFNKQLDVLEKCIKFFKKKRKIRPFIKRNPIYDSHSKMIEEEYE